MVSKMVWMTMVDNIDKDDDGMDNNSMYDGIEMKFG